MSDPAAFETPPDKLAGSRILVVEDDRLLSAMLEDALTILGCTAIRASDIAGAAALLGTSTPDGAILDVNVAGEKVYPIAHELSRRGIPFFFVTGYVNAEVPSEYRDRPFLKKPFRVRDLERHLESILKTDLPVLPPRHVPKPSPST
jgi:DNA-binding response OmpR family regulator